MANLIDRFPNVKEAIKERESVLENRLGNEFGRTATVPLNGGYSIRLYNRIFPQDSSLFNRLGVGASIHDNDGNMISSSGQSITIPKDPKTLEKVIATPKFNETFMKANYEAAKVALNRFAPGLVSKFVQKHENGSLPEDKWNQFNKDISLLDQDTKDAIIPDQTIEGIAEETHEALREMKQALGDDMPDWNHAEQWMRDSTKDMIKSIAENPNQDGKDVHDAWLKQKEAAGWKYGPEKSAELKTHPLMVPYEDLPFEEQFKDDLVRHSIDTGLKMAREGKFDQAELKEENREFLKDHESELGIKSNDGPKGPGE